MQQTRMIRVGVYENAPKIFTDEYGKVSGFWPELMSAIARDHNWQIVWVHCTWDECMRKLEKNEIDVMPDTGWTTERSRIFTFSNETILVSWARLYVPPGSKIETILDLDGKTVAGVTGSLNFDGSEGIKDLARRFNIHPTFIEKENYNQVFEALGRKEVSAGITNKDFGNLNEKKFEVTRTSIIIQPVEIRFAFSKDGPQTAYLIDAVDRSVRQYKMDPDSEYHRAIERYFSDQLEEHVVEIVPAWINTLMLVGAGILLFLIAVNISSRVQVQRQTAAIRASEARTRALLDNLPDLIFRLDKQGKFLDYRSANTEQLILTPQNFLGKEISDVLPQDVAQESRRFMQKAIESRTMQIHEYKINRKEGIRYYEARYSASIDDEVVVVIRDITRRKETEEALKKSEERFQTLARISPVGIFRTDADGSTNYVNPTWSMISGLNYEEALGDGWLKAVHPDDRLPLQTNWEESARKQVPSHADYRFIHPDGRTTWVIGQAVPETNSDGQIVGYVGTITDITERKQTEAALERSIASERSALALARTIQDANLALSRSLNLDQVLQTLLDYLSRLVPFDSAGVLLLDDRGELSLCAMRRSESTQEIPLPPTLQFDLKSNAIIRTVIQERTAILVGDTRQFEGWISPTAIGPGLSWMGIPLIAGGDVLGLYSLDKSIPGFFTHEVHELAETLSAQAAVAIQNANLLNELQLYAAELEQRVAERTTELERRVAEVESLNSAMVELMEVMKVALQKAESADRLKSAFLATMSHELRTPLNSIIGFTGILLQKMVGPLTEEQEKQLGMVQSSARHLLELINDVLDISKIEADQVEITYGKFNLSASIRKSVDKIRLMAEKKGLDVYVEILPEEIEIVSDRRRVEQILLNLLNNAVKFTERGSIHLSCRANDDSVVIQVRDTGIGIKTEDLPLLFQPFRQIDTGITRQYEGTGLGLSICKRLVGLLGGKIEVESESQKGSTFTITLPLSREKE